MAVNILLKTYYISNIAKRFANTVVTLSKKVSNISVSFCTSPSPLPQCRVFCALYYKWDKISHFIYCNNQINDLSGLNSV